MEWTELLKVYGPMAIGWLVAGYLMKFILQRYDADIESRVKLAASLENLARVIEAKNGG